MNILPNMIYGVFTFLPHSIIAVAVHSYINAATCYELRHIAIQSTIRVNFIECRHHSLQRFCSSLYRVSTIQRSAPTIRCHFVCVRALNCVSIRFLFWCRVVCIFQRFFVHTGSLVRSIFR